MSPPSKKECAHAYHFANKDRINAHRRHIYQQKKDALSIHMIESNIPTPTPTTSNLLNHSLPFSNHNETFLLPSIQTEATTSNVHTNHLPSLDYPSTSQTTSSATIQNTIPQPNIATHSFNENLISQTNQCFRLKLDNLHSIHVCFICKESYPGLHFRYLNGEHTCSRCCSEKNAHRFSLWNNMYPGEQPLVLSILTQVEEMLISRVNPIFQVTHAHGGQ